MDNNSVLEMAKMNIQGNTIDNGWLKNLKYENGKTNLNACVLLGEIFNQWKLKNYYINDNIELLASKTGLTTRQVHESIKFLFKNNVIKKLYNNNFDIINKLKNKNINNYSIEGNKKCSLCNISTFVLHAHHYPIKKSDGGKKVIYICPNCHSEYHYMENILILNLEKLITISGIPRKDGD